MKAVFKGSDPFLTTGKEYTVLSVDVPFPKTPFIRVMTDYDEDYLFPWDQFEISEGLDQLVDLAMTRLDQEVVVCPGWVPDQYDDDFSGESRELVLA